MKIENCKDCFKRHRKRYFSPVKDEQILRCSINIDSVFSVTVPHTHTHTCLNRTFKNVCPLKSICRRSRNADAGSLMHKLVADAGNGLEVSAAWWPWNCCCKCLLIGIDNVYCLVLQVSADWWCRSLLLCDTGTGTSVAGCCVVT